MIGTLTQAYTSLEWGGETLHAYAVSGDITENVAQRVSVKLNKSESGPTATFEITPNPAGFELFAKLKKEALDKPFKVTYGYLNGSKMGPMSFRFSGINMTTGHDPKLEITGVSVVKGAWTDNKISFTMEEEIPLTAYPDLLKSKCGKGCEDLNFTFIGKAKETAQKIMIKGNQMQRTPQNIITDVIRTHGMLLQVGDNAFGGEMIISYSPKKEKELEQDKPEVKPKDADAVPAERKVYVIGPGLMENITRKQSFNIGASATNNAASRESPVIPQTEDIPVMTSQNPSPQVDASESQNAKGGTWGQDNEGPSHSGSTPPGEEGREAQVAIAKQITSKCTLKFEMVPYIVGIKPRDLIAIPSLKGPGDFIEDWEVTSVSYQQNNSGGVNISLSGERPFTGEEPLLDEASLKKVKELVKPLITPALWNKFYWIQGPENDRQLAA